MVSYNYRVIVTEPGQAAVELDQLGGRTLTSASATEYAHRLGYLTAGTTIRIRRIRLTCERIDPRDDAAGQRAQWLAYRAYEVGSDGIVRRTDRSPGAKGGAL